MYLLKQAAKTENSELSIDEDFRNHNMLRTLSDTELLEGRNKSGQIKQNMDTLSEKIKIGIVTHHITPNEADIPSVVATKKELPENSHSNDIETVQVSKNDVRHNKNNGIYCRYNPLEAFENTQEIQEMVDYYKTTYEQERMIRLNQQQIEGSIIKVSYIYIYILSICLCGIPVYNRIR